MKKTRLFGMLVLAAALVFGAVSCKQDAGNSQSSQNSWDNSKDDSTDNPTNSSTNNSTDDSKGNSTDNSKDDSKTSWDNLKDVLAADEDLSGTWKLTDYSEYIKIDEKTQSSEAESAEILLLTKQLAKDYFNEMITTYETAYGGGGEVSATINGKRDEIQVYFYYKSSEDGHDFEIEMEFTLEKQ